jgi:hypothetical protein
MRSQLLHEPVVLMLRASEFLIRAWREQRFARLREEVRPEAVGIHGGFYLAQNEQSGEWWAPVRCACSPTAKWSGDWTCSARLRLG